MPELKIDAVAERLYYLAGLIASHRFSYDNEKNLQFAIGELLEKSNVPFEREVRISNVDRIDFMVSGLGIEVKIKGSLADLTYQLHRYAQHANISSLLLVTTRSCHRAAPRSVNGKPISVVWLGGAF